MKIGKLNIITYQKCCSSGIMMDGTVIETDRHGVSFVWRDKKKKTWSKAFHWVPLEWGLSYRSAEERNFIRIRLPILGTFVYNWQEPEYVWENINKPEKVAVSSGTSIWRT